MPKMSQALLLVVIAVALTLSSNQIFAKKSGPDQVKTSGTSATASGSAKPKPTHSCAKDPQPGCSNYVPGHTQPPCHGGHMGPNGVMVQCQ
jgi:hypothetical protein